MSTLRVFHACTGDRGGFRGDTGLRGDPAVRYYPGWLVDRYRQPKAATVTTQGNCGAHVTVRPDDPDNPPHPDERVHARRNGHWSRRGGTAITDRPIGSFDCWCGRDRHDWPGRDVGRPHPVPTERLRR